MRLSRGIQRRISTISENIRTADDYCMNLVKNNDFENYLAGLLIPKQYRGAYFAVRAYNVELATLKDQMNGNAVAGRIRFQWWRDTIDEIYNKKESSHQQPVAYALSYYCNQHGLTKRWFERSLEARQRDTILEQHETLDDLENYAEQSHSSILYLLLESMNIRDENTNYMASHIGVCSGLTTLLRGFPFHISKRQTYIPRDTMQKNSISIVQLLSGPPNAEDKGLRTALQNCIFDVASQAHGHLDRARILHKGEENTAPISKLAINICSPAIRSSMFLEELRRVNFDPYHHDLHKNIQLKFQYQLLRMRFMNVF